MIKERMRNRHWEATTSSGMSTRRGDPKDKEGAGQCQNREGDKEVMGSQGYGKPDLTSELMAGPIKAV